MTYLLALCGLWGCKNRACSVSWPQVIKGIPDQQMSLFCWLGPFLLFLFCVQYVYDVLHPYFWLSVPVQSIALKESSLK